MEDRTEELCAATLAWLEEDGLLLGDESLAEIAGPVLVIADLEDAFEALGWPDPGAELVGQHTVVARDGISARMHGRHTVVPSNWKG